MAIDNTTNRRNFIKNSALFGTGLVLGTPFNITANPLKVGDKVNIAVVGCGGRGRGVIFNNIPKIPSANLVAVCDIVESRREQAKNEFNSMYGAKVKAYENFHKMLEKENLDAVALITP
ncbi:MAG: Gfo/Idh/MocA family oxidoreductase, partial [Bacteroidota bacterium]